MTVAFDAFTAGGAGGFTHTPVGTPAGALVLVAIAGQITDTITAVSYGASDILANAVALSPLLGNQTKDYVLYGYFLGSSVPTGAQTVTVSASVGTPRVSVITLTGAADLEVVDTSVHNAAASTNPSVTLSLASRTSFGVIQWGSGIGNPVNVTPLTGWTSRTETDEGNNTNGCYTYNTIAATDITAGYTAGSEDQYILAVAISEVVGGGGATLLTRTLLGAGI